MAVHVMKDLLSSIAAEKAQLDALRPIASGALRALQSLMHQRLNAALEEYVSTLQSALPEGM